MSLQPFESFDTNRNNLFLPFLHFIDEQQMPCDVRGNFRKCPVVYHLMVLFDHLLQYFRCWGLNAADAMGM
jgi:hypothetical protein